MDNSEHLESFSIIYLAAFCNIASFEYLGTFVMKIIATDADEPNHKNSQIGFKIVSQDPSHPQAFRIDPATGEVRTTTYNLDREVFFVFVLCLSPLLQPI